MLTWFASHDRLAPLALSQMSRTRHCADGASSPPTSRPTKDGSSSWTWLPTPMCQPRVSGRASVSVWNRPADRTAHNSRLIYARMTGWGQSGPLSQRAGHDINHISVTGALHAIGPTYGSPVTPLNLVGDFGGGSMFLVTGILAALHERQSTGSGRVLDVAMVDGVAVLEQAILSMRETGMWNDGRGSNLIDGGAPF